MSNGGGADDVRGGIDSTSRGTPAPPTLAPPAQPHDGPKGGACTQRIWHAYRIQVARRGDNEKTQQQRKHCYDGITFS